MTQMTRECRGYITMTSRYPFTVGKLWISISLEALWQPSSIGSLGGRADYHVITWQPNIYKCMSHIIHSPLHGPRGWDLPEPLNECCYSTSLAHIDSSSSFNPSTHSLSIRMNLSLHRNISRVLVDGVQHRSIKRNVSSIARLSPVAFCFPPCPCQRCSGRSSQTR